MDKNQRTLKTLQDIISGLSKIKQDLGQVVVEKSKFVAKPEYNQVGKTKLAKTKEQAMLDARVRAAQLGQYFQEDESLSEEQKKEIDDMVAAEFGKMYIDKALGIENG